MRKNVFVFVFVVAATLLAAGAASAVTQECGGGTCRGTDGPDLLRGTPRIDKIFGQGGDDRLYGYRKADTLKGGGGADTLYGGGGDNVIKGQFGGDRIFGGGGDETLRAATIKRVDDGAHDVIDCGGGTDTVYFVPVQDSVADNCEIRNPPQP